MIEAGVIVIDSKPAFWHLPDGRTISSIPDIMDLWDAFWSLRKEDDLGFAHSHPGYGVPTPSHTDLTTFSAIELGLGRRLKWWITSSSHVIELKWIGPGKYDYDSVVILEMDWALELRAVSDSEKQEK